MNINDYLSDRKQIVLNAIVNDYITHGEPLGSRTLCKRHGFTVSPATIRNEMAELEEYGLLFQPHTSAGRIPSHKGYRIFVDYLMDDYTPTPQDQQFILRLRQTSQAVDAILSQAIQILSEATECIAIAEAPQLRTNPVKGLHIIPIDNLSLVLSLTFSSDIQRQSVIRLSQPIYSEILSVMTNYLNSRLNNTSLDELFHQIVTGPLEREIQYYKNLVVEMVSEIYAQAQRDEKLYMTGTSHLLREPEFQKMEEAYPILQFLERDNFVRNLLHHADSELQKTPSHVQCMIGYENPYEALQNCSVIATRYHIAQKDSGMIGIVGPTRIDYSRVTSLLNAVANRVTTALTDLFSESKGGVYE